LAVDFGRLQTTTVVPLLVIRFAAGRFVQKVAMKFLCLSYFDERRREKVSSAESERLLGQSVSFELNLVQQGIINGGQLLGNTPSAVTLTVKNGAIDVNEGPCLTAEQSLASVFLFEARDMNHAISLISQHPGIRMFTIEIRSTFE
jgi:hypothetical protein